MPRRGPSHGSRASSLLDALHVAEALQGISMSTPHAAGDATLIRQSPPDWSPGAIAIALKRSATPLACPADWQPLDGPDDRQHCHGSANRNSFFGAGLVNTSGAAPVPRTGRQSVGEAYFVVGWVVCHR
jgi:hypothetical protein